MKKTLIVVIASLSLTLVGCGATKNVAQEQKEANQKNELFTTTQAAVEKLTKRLAKAKTDNLSYYANELYKDALDEMDDVNDEFDDIRFSPQNTTKTNAADIMSYVLKTNTLLDQAYIVKKTIETTLAATTTQVSRLTAINVDKLYPRTFKKYSKVIDGMVKDLADGDLKDVQEEQAKLLPLLYALEAKAIKHIKLSGLQKSLNALKSSRAKRVAPISYQKAVASLQSAESVITANPRATEDIDVAVEKVKLEIAHVKHIILEIKSLAVVKTKTRETYILKQENKIKTVAEALNLSDLRALSITEQFNSLSEKAMSVVSDNAYKEEKLTALTSQLVDKDQLISANTQGEQAVANKLDEKLIYIGQLEQKLISTKAAHQQALLAKENELLSVKNTLQQFQLATKKATAPIAPPTVAPAKLTPVTPAMPVTPETKVPEGETEAVSQASPSSAPLEIAPTPEVQEKQEAQVEPETQAVAEVSEEVAEVAAPEPATETTQETTAEPTPSQATTP